MGKYKMLFVGGVMDGKELSRDRKYTRFTIPLGVSCNSRETYRRDLGTDIFYFESREMWSSKSEKYVVVSEAV